MAAASVSPFVKPVGIAASIIAIVQAIVWIVLALCAGLIYLEVWKPKLEMSTYGETLSNAIVSLYLTASSEPAPSTSANGVYIQPLQFFIWAMLYLIISILWVSISCYQLFVVMENKHAVIKKTFLIWAMWTTIVCFCDLVFASLLASDYNSIVKLTNLTEAHLTVLNYIVLAAGVVMTLVARGFVLWIINVALVGIVMKLSLDFPKEVPNQGYSSSSNVNAYGQPNPTGQGFHNPNYTNTWDANKPDFTRSDSFIAAPSHPAPDHLPKLPPIASTNERLAKIGGRQGPKGPAPVPPPKLPQSYIYPTQPRVPSPDYSPPNSPLQTPLKSALKNRNQNLYGYSNNRY